MLAEYTLEELAYEYYLTSEQLIVARKIVEDNDKIQEELKEQEDLAWADEMAQEDGVDLMDPQPDDLSDDEWVEQQLAAEKQKFGESFGEDVNLSFDEV